ncbi:flagellar FlbD family protein [Stratiformator vulcanicus]|uniref:Flagellar protein (FlbD) n=1 Tax=Stratiformator vulcanicus TaxID=2527980 RepID=A0A517R5A7_9PLAN|nr:flagellar FlbD family protein [Stratiformator vulcanicus]QDT39052.1 Flagellar protein (FlbD) [Stratiformator vulcanicus]
MIKLTKLNGDEFVLNAELIRFVESRPDTYITLDGHERVIVREALEEVVARCLAYRRALQLSKLAA